MADSLHFQIWNALKGKVVAAQVSGQPLDAVKTNSLFEGVKDTVPSGAFPIVVMEPDSEEEITHTVPNRLLVTYRFQFHLAIEHMKPEKQIASSGVFGIIEFAQRMKNVLTADQKLGLGALGVLRVRIPSTKYFVDNYPIREASLTVEVQAQVVEAAR